MRKLFFLLFLTLGLQFASAQNRTISGVVTDAGDQSTIPGVTVMVVGSTQGTITDIDGNYTLSVPAGTTELKFSFIGMDAQVVNIEGKTTVDVALQSGAIAVEELVVVGFGAQKKESVVGSVVQAKGEELLKVGSVATVSEALSGVLPGVSTMQASGQPGSSDATILIRGQSSWGNNNPLFMVDGVERDFNDVDPNEIESISVLKDASATAVFGVKAANGVILITTKRGEEGKASVNYSGNYGIKVPVMETDYMEDYATAMEFFSIAAVNEGEYGALVPQSEIDAWSMNASEQAAWEQSMRATYGDDWNYKYSDFYSYTNWMKEMISTGTVQSHNINVSGGNKFVKYFTSLGYNYDGDIFNIQEQENYDPRTYQKRYNWRNNLDFNFTETTKLSVNLAGNFKDWHGNSVTGNWNAEGSEAGDIVSNNSFLAGMFSSVQVGAPPVLSDGTLGAGNRYTDWLSSNYLGDLERRGEVTKRATQVFSDVIFEQKFLNDFKFKAKVSYNFAREYVSRIVEKPLYYLTDWSDGSITQAGDNKDRVVDLPNNEGESINSYNNSLYYELALDYNKTVNDVHNISALALFSRRQAQWMYFFPSFEESWVGRATYNYKLKYMFEFNGAYNGSAYFQNGRKFGFFPSLALGWTLSEEDFFKTNLGFIDFFKIRYSWGQVGSDAGVSGYTYVSDYGTRTAYDGTQNGMFAYGAPYASFGTIYYEGQPANVFVTWETATKQNLGIELNLLDNRLNTSFDFFNEYRENIIDQRNSLPSWFGNIAPDANFGETKNHGIDVELSWNDKINLDWSYYVTANVSISENRIIFRDDAIYTPEYKAEAGKPIGWNQGHVQMGYLNSWDDVFNYTQPAAANRIPGDFVFNDYNADGLIDGNDQVAIENPSYASNSFAFGFGLSYKQWSLSTLFNGAFGLSKSLSDNYLWPYATTGGDREFRILKTEMQNYWTPENTSPESPALHTVSNNYNDWVSTYSVRNSNYIRFRSLELKYTFKKEALHRLKVVEGLEVYGNGNNLLTWTPLPDMFDPEASRLEVYPITKRFTFGLRAKF